jgi:phosphatidylserine decarboxylase
MTLHREGFKIIGSTFLILAAICWGIYWLLGDLALLLSVAGCLIMLFLVVQFFRVPKRVVSASDNEILCPADGKVVVIESTFEGEYLNKEVTQISVFMSPLNVHVNYSPLKGVVSYFKYHPGSYLVAWHPKSSTENERTTVAVKHASGSEVLFRQIAGAVARRICWYVKENDQLDRAQEFGFIKFGSRVDIFIPTEWKVNVAIGDKVKGTQTVLATMP